MSRRAWAWQFVVCALLTMPVSLTPPARAADRELEGAAAKRGIEVLRALSVDLDGDRRPEALVAGLVERGITLSLWRKVDEKPYQQLFASEIYDGDAVLRLEARQLVADATLETILELREASPDETLRRLIVSRWHNATLIPVFEGTFPTGNIEKAEPGETILAFGETTAGYRLLDIDGDGQVELMLRRDLKTVLAQRPDRSTLRAVVGARETVMRFDPKAGRAGEFVTRQEQFFPYLIESRPTRFSGSSQRLPPELDRKYKREAIDRGVTEVFHGIHSSAPAVDAGAQSEDAGQELAMQRDPAPLAGWGADGKIETAWCVGVAGDGQGQWWRADFSEPTDLRMVRLVFGDASSAKAMARSNDVTGFVLVFSTGDRVTVDRKDLSFCSGPLAGIRDTPLGGDRPGVQTMVLLSKSIRATWVQVDIGRVQRRAKSGETCLAEAVLYGPQPSSM
ncbi:MAG: hypothetical protein JXR83_06115 [Deltaproteobacteria bacterium]|nr:hypothetical protein [Deltaproteobacteria bacterium]